MLPKGVQLIIFDACPRPNGDRRRLPARGAMAAAWCIASDQGPRGEPYAKGDPRRGEPASGPRGTAIVDDLLGARMNTAAELVERCVCETLTYYAFPDIHWPKIRTNNRLERIMKEIRRRARVVGAFPGGQSYLNLAAARLRYI